MFARPWKSTTPVRCAALTAAFLSLVVTARLLGGGGDFSRFVLASHTRADPNQVPEVLTLGVKEYDGQFFYRLALRPWTSERSSYDGRNERANRIGQGRIGPSDGQGRPRCNHLQPMWTPCNRTRANPLLFLRLIGFF